MVRIKGVLGKNPGQKDNRTNELSEIILKDLLYCTEVGNDFADSEKSMSNEIAQKNSRAFSETKLGQTSNNGKDNSNLLTSRLCVFFFFQHITLVNLLNANSEF